MKDIFYYHINKGTFERYRKYALDRVWLKSTKQDISTARIQQFSHRKFNKRIYIIDKCFLRGGYVIDANIVTVIFAKEYFLDYTYYVRAL